LALGEQTSKLEGAFFISKKGSKFQRKRGYFPGVWDIIFFTGGGKAY